ncbi:MAG: FCD domain-containing protein [Hyphomicrobiaceae bacterium]|nr:FCD domain-containing protein [Hyphomicrobiaceae bacterium]
MSRETVTAEPSAEHIANILAAEVHSGQLVVGEAFPTERELCDRFSVSRNVVRAAITSVESMGLIDHLKGFRPRVAAPSLAKVMDRVGDAAGLFFEGSQGRAHLEQARLFLETSIVRYATEHATNAQKAKMVEHIDACEACLGDIAAFREADVKFHRSIVEVTGNPVFLALHDSFVNRLMKSRPTPNDALSHNSRSNEDHRKIVRAVLDRDADLAVSLVSDHLIRNYDDLFRQSLDRRSSNPDQNSD